MHNSVSALDKRSGIADPLVLTPPQLAVLERAQVSQYLLLKIERLSRLQLGRYPQRSRNRLGVGTGVGLGGLSDSRANCATQREDGQCQNGTREQRGASRAVHKCAKHTPITTNRGCLLLACGAVKEQLFKSHVSVSSLFPGLV